MINKIGPYLRSKFKKTAKKATAIFNSYKYGIKIPVNMILGKNVDIILAKNTIFNIGNAIHIGDYSMIKFFEPASQLSLGNHVSLRRSVLISLFGGNLKIGDNVSLNNNCSISCFGFIEIGDHSMLGENVKLYDHNHKYELRDSKLYTYPNDFNIGKITIGKNCWIASDVTILNNVTIGDNCIIGAGCLVYKSVPPNTILKNSQSLISLTH